jgi:hypothetical protein
MKKLFTPLLCPSIMDCIAKGSPHNDSKIDPTQPNVLIKSSEYPLKGPCTRQSHMT